MVVDDNCDAADIVAEFLIISGPEAIAVYDGAEALRMADAFEPDVVFLDLGMPASLNDILGLLGPAT